MGICGVPLTDRARNPGGKFPKQPLAGVAPQQVVLQGKVPLKVEVLSQPRSSVPGGGWHQGKRWRAGFCRGKGELQSALSRPLGDKARSRSSVPAVLQMPLPPPLSCFIPGFLTLPGFLFSPVFSHVCTSWPFIAFTSSAASRGSVPEQPLLPAGRKPEWLPGCICSLGLSFSLVGDPTRPATLETDVTRPLLRGGPVEDYESLGQKDPRQVEKEYYRMLRNQRVLLASFAAVLGNFNFGFALVYTSPVIPALVKSPVPNLQLTQATASWFGSIFTLGVAAGGLCTMYFNDRLGRKLSIMFSAIPSVIGYFFMAGAYEVWMLLVGRLLTGFAGGVTSAAIPVYISEISHPGIRGALGSCPQIMAVLGALFLYALGLLVPWRWLAVAGEVPVLLMICLVFFMPDSPRFLISKGKEDEALGALQWLRGKDVDFWWEYEQIKASVQEQSQPISWTEIRKPYIVKPIAITLLMRFLQQLSGVTPILVYLQLIFDSTEVILAPQYDAVIVGGVRLASVLVAAFSMDKAGRKILLYVSACIMLASNLTLGLYIHFIPRFSHNCSAMVVNGTHEGLANSSMVGLTVIPLIATMFFIIGYAMGWGPITWLLMAEVLPLKARGVVSGLCVLVSWLTAFAVTKVFLLVKEKYGLEVPFFFFSTICVVSLVFTYLIPETKGKSLERIESYFRTGRRSFLESFRRHR